MSIKNKKYSAISCILLSTLSYSIVQFCVKLTPNIPIMEKILFRNIFSTIIAYFIVKKYKYSLFGKKENQILLFCRTLGGYIGMNLFFSGTMHLSLSAAAIINKLSPFFVLIFSYFFLKEKVTKLQIFAILLALLGSWLVIKPEFSNNLFYIVILLLSAILSSVAFTALRALRKKENQYTIVFHYSFFSIIFSIPFTFFNFYIPNIKSLLILLAVGIFSATGQIALTFAYKMAPASKISIYDFSNVIFSSIIGYFFLNEKLDLLDITGIVIIIFSFFLIIEKSERS